MKKSIYRGEWAGSSHLNERREELSKAHEEFLKLLASGFKLKEVHKVRTKRPRIKKETTPRQVVVSLGTVMAATVTLSWEDYQKRGQGLRIVMRIY